jgi:hypothetical protein
MIELLSVAGFTCMVLVRLILSFYYVRYRPHSPCPESEFVRPYPARATTVYVTEWEARLVGSMLRNVAITFWLLGLVTVLITRR